jgi:hypothetical protein
MRLSHLIEEDGITYRARSENIDPDDVMAPLQAHRSRVGGAQRADAGGPRRGRRMGATHHNPSLR